MRKIIVTKSQLMEFVETKKAEKVYYDIIEQMNMNQKMLNKNISHKKANQSIIDKYNNKKLLSPKVSEMLKKNKIINENNEII